MTVENPVQNDELSKPRAHDSSALVGRFLPFRFKISSNGHLESLYSFTWDDTASNLSNFVGKPAPDLIDHRDITLWQLMEMSARKQGFAGPVAIRLSPDIEISSEICPSADQENDYLFADFALCISEQSDGQQLIELGLRPFRYDRVTGATTGRERTLTPRSDYAPGDFDVLASRITAASRALNADNKSVWEVISRMLGYARIGGNNEALSRALWGFWKLLTDAGDDARSKRELAEKRAQTEQERIAADEAVAPGAREREAEIHKELKEKFEKSVERDPHEPIYLNVSGPDGLTQTETVKAAVYTINKAAASGKAVTLDALTGAYDDKLAETKGRIRKLKSIIMAEQFDMALQPIVDFRSETIHHFEALARFNPDLGIRNPGDVIGFAEDIGLIHEFDMAMISKVCSITQRVRRLGYRPNIAINISGKSIQSPFFLRQFFRVIEDIPDLRDQISFELTESSEITDLDGTNRIIKRLHAYGHKIALDDFGAGSAGLQYLKELDVDIVKIDGSHIKEAIHKPRDRDFLISLVTLCKAKQIEVVGECVETHEERLFLENIGIDYGQGWYFSKPTNVQDALELM